MEHYTLEQEVALLPWVREQQERLEKLTKRQVEIQDWLDHLHERVRSNGHSSHAEEAGAFRIELQEIEAKQAAVVQAFVDRDIILRDGQQGLVDFVSVRNGRDVYLCWLEGEDTIGFWHDLNTGFAGRQPL